MNESVAPLAEDAALMKPVSELLVLGSLVSSEASQEQAVEHRLQMAWKAWHATRPQLRQRGVPLRSRVRLLRSVVWATCAWGLESLNLSKVLLRKLDGVQRSMISGMTGVARRPHEPPPDYFRPERIVSGIISRHLPSKWGRAQRSKFFYFSGHVARQDPEVHWAAAALRWRSALWWSKYRRALPAKAGGQRGRRLAHSGPICRFAKPLAEAYAMAARTEALPRGLDVPSSWAMARCREMFNTFSQWAVLQRFS